MLFIKVMTVIIMSIFIERAQLYKHIGYTQVTIFLEALSLQHKNKNKKTLHTRTHTHTVKVTVKLFFAIWKLFFQHFYTNRTILTLNV